jgi:hypothetical protein
VCELSLDQATPPDLEYRLHALRLGPGDVVVFSIDMPLTREQIREMRANIEQAFALFGISNRFLILHLGMDAHILTKADIEALP